MTRKQFRLIFDSSVTKLEHMKDEFEKVKEQHREIQENLKEAKRATESDH